MCRLVGERVPCSGGAERRWQLFYCIPFEVYTSHIYASPVSGRVGSVGVLGKNMDYDSCGELTSGQRVERL